MLRILVLKRSLSSSLSIKELFQEINKNKGLLIQPDLYCVILIEKFLKCLFLNCLSLYLINSFNTISVKFDFNPMPL